MIEANAHEFWQAALRITRDDSSGQEMINKLHDHIVINFPIFKITPESNQIINNNKQKNKKKLTDR